MTSKKLHLIEKRRTVLEFNPASACCTVSVSPLETQILEEEGQQVQCWPPALAPSVGPRGSHGEAALGRLPQLTSLTLLHSPCPDSTFSSLTRLTSLIFSFINLITSSREPSLTSMTRSNFHAVASQDHTMKVSPFPGIYHHWRFVYRQICKHR